MRRSLSAGDLFTLGGFVLTVIFLISSISIGSWFGILFWGFFLIWDTAHLYKKFRPGGFEDIRTIIIQGAAQLEQGQAPQIIEKLERERADGKYSLASTLMLVEAYNFVGWGPRAEPLAREVLNRIHTDGTVHKQDQTSRFVTDIAFIALSDSACGQGRFVEAAQVLQPRTLSALRPGYIRVTQAWLYFLGGQIDQARMLLDGFVPTNHDITPKYRVIWAYMRYKIWNEDPRPTFRQDLTQLGKWDAECMRNGKNPYGLRLREIMDEIHTLMNV